MAKRQFQNMAFLVLLLTTLKVEKVTSVNAYESSRNDLEGDGGRKVSYRNLLSYLPLDKIGGGIVLRELTEEENPESSLNLFERYDDDEKLKIRKVNNSTLPLTKNQAILSYNSALKRQPREISAQNSYYPKRNVDEIDGSGFRSMGKRNFDEIDGSGFRGMGKRDFDEIDRSGFRGMGKRNFDEIDVSGFRSMGKRHLDEIDRSGFRGMRKRNFDEIDGSGFRGMGKRNFDEIDGSGFRGMGKRNFDEIDLSGIRSMGKRHLNEIDRTGLSNVGKRNIHEIGKAGGGIIGQKSLKESSKANVRSMKKRFINRVSPYPQELAKRNLDEIDRSGFHIMGKRSLKFINGVGFRGFTKRNIKNFNVPTLNIIDKKALYSLNKPSVIKQLHSTIKRRSINKNDKLDFNKFRTRYYTSKNWVNNSGTIFKRNVDERAHPGFSQIDKRKVKEPLQTRDQMSNQNEFGNNSDFKRSGSVHTTRDIGIDTLIKKPYKNNSLPNPKRH